MAALLSLSLRQFQIISFPLPLDNMATILVDDIINGIFLH